MEVLRLEQSEVTRYCPSSPERYTPWTRTVRCSPSAIFVCNSHSRAAWMGGGDCAASPTSPTTQLKVAATLNLLRIFSPFRMNGPPESAGSYFLGWSSG